MLLYAIHPLLNVVIYGIAKRTLLLSVMITSVLYGVIMFFVPGGGGFYYNQLVGFIVIYFIIAYLKIYLPTFMENKRINLILCICSFVLLICEIAGTDYLCLKINRLSHQLGHWRTFSNPPIVLCSITLLNLFRTLRFNSRTVNYISSCSMLIYIIHENWLFREYLRTDYFRWIYYAFTYDKLLLWCFLLALVSFAASLTVAAIYKKTIQGRIYWLSDRIYAVLSRCGNAILNFVLKLN